MKSGFLAAVVLFSGLAEPCLAQLWKGQPGDIAKLEREARAGKAGAMSEYAWHLIEGQGGRPYVAKEIYDYFSNAAAAGDALGKVGLSRCLSRGIGVEADFEKAWQLAEETAKGGHPEGYKQMAFLLGQGLGVTKDRKRATELSQKAADGGSVAAQVNLLIYTDANQRDRYAAHAEVALRYGNILAARNSLWGYVFLRGEEEWFDRNGKLIELVESRAELGHPDALMALAFVRGCQGNDDARTMLHARAGMTGTGEGVSSLCTEIGNDEDRKASEGPPPIYTTVSGRHALQWFGYSHGERSDSAIVQASLALADGFEGRKGDATASRKLMVDNLPGPGKSRHHWLARGNVRYLGKGGSEELGRLTVAHTIYSSDTYYQSIGFLSYLLSGAVPAIKTDLPRAYAAHLATPDKEPQKKKNAERFEGKLSPEQIAEAEALVKEGYPTAEKFVSEAEKVLEAAKELAPSQG